MVVEYAVELRVEFIPEGQTQGPTKNSCLKIFKKGTCGILGAVLGWPNLDFPLVPGGEGLGCVPTEDGFEFRALSVKIPRLDDRRKADFNAAVARYTASKGQLMAIDDVTGESVRLLDEDAGRQFRAAALLANAVPTAKMAPCGVDFFVLDPGERAVVPTTWSKNGGGQVKGCSTHPEAPVGLAVFPGACPSQATTNVIVENKAPLPITVTDNDFLAVAHNEASTPSVESCLAIQQRQEEFCRTLDWNG